MMSRTWFNAVYPFEHTALEKWNTIVSISLFSSLILLLLQPFGFTPINKLLLFAGYGVISFISFNVNYFGFHYFFPALFEDKKWTVSKALLFLAYNFLIIGFWNHIFNAYVINKNPELLTSGSELGVTLIKTMTIGLVASGFLVLIRYNYLTRRHLQDAQVLNNKLKEQLGHEHIIDDPEVIELTLDNSSLSFERGRLKFIQSQGNYLAFHFDHQRIPKLYRGRIKNLEHMLDHHPEYFRCHRSYIVNLNFVESSQGNSQGLYIKLRDVDEKVPVARPKIKLFKASLDHKLQGEKRFIT